MHKKLVKAGIILSTLVSYRLYVEYWVFKELFTHQGEQGLNLKENVSFASRGPLGTCFF